MAKKLFIFLISLMVLSIGKSTIVAEGSASDFRTMLAILEQNKDMTVKEWSVVARETMDSVTTEDQLMLKVDRLKEALPHFKWSIIKESSMTVIIGEGYHASFIESVTVASTLLENKETYVTYEMKGTDVSENTKQALLERVSTIKKLILNRNTIFFTCVKGEINGNIDGVLISKMEDLLSDFKALEVESVKENQFLSITANSLLFDHSSISEKYNLQLAMRIDGMGQKTSFVIGTPIITFEY